MQNMLKQYRIKNQMTQKELSIKVGVSSNYISMIERGVRDPSFKLAYQLSVILKVTINKIFKF